MISYTVGYCDRFHVDIMAVNREPFGEFCDALDEMLMAKEWNDDREKRTPKVYKTKTGQKRIRIPAMTPEEIEKWQKKS